MQNLSDPDTELDEFFEELGATSAEVAPVARRRRPQLFTNMADTFEAFGRDPEALQADDREVAADARGGDRVVPRPAPVPGRLRRPLGAAAPGGRRSCRGRCPRSTPRSRSARRCCRARRAERETSRTSSTRSTTSPADPSTLLALRDLDDARRGPARCSSSSRRTRRSATTAIYFLHPLGEHQSQVQNGPTGGGTVLSQGVKLVNQSQPYNYGTTLELAPGRHPAGQEPDRRDRRRGQPAAPALRHGPYRPRSTRRATPTARPASAATSTGR